jgi:Fe-S-cluster formation regulator IscX/YfhJ
MKKPYRKVKPKEPKKLTFNEVHQLIMELIKVIYDKK